MDEMLRKQDRDIVMNLCEYGLGNVWEWGGEVGQCWRTTGDLGAPEGSGLPNFYQIGLSNARHFRYAKPGCWNDPDYLLIGWIGDTAQLGSGFRRCTLTPDEQYAYMSLWCLMAAPLIHSGDMTKLDAFTLSVLCNAEIIEVDQDPLGRQAKIIAQDAEKLILAKPMEDGSMAVGLFNLSPRRQTVAVKWSDLGIVGPQTVRDLWRQKALDAADETFAAPLERHGVQVIRLRAKPPAR
jgi:alpha-galactosidase